MLSIIVPIYNVEKYLDECLQSIINQTFIDYEVILVNDGSTDQSLIIAEKYCKLDCRFKVYTKENGGLSSARNYGLSYASKKYLTFLDSDDYLANNTYELMMEKIVEKDLDIVMSNIEYFFEDGRKGYILKGLNDTFNDIKSKQALLSPMFAWNKIYRRSFFMNNDLRYPEGLWYEDIPVSSSLFSKTDKIDYVDIIGYYYRQRTSSIMGQRSKKMKDIFIILEMMKNYYIKNNLFDKYYDEIEYLFVEHIMLYGQFRFLVSDNHEILYINSVKFMKEHFPRYKKNKYLKLLSAKNKIFINTLNKYTIVLFRQYLKRT